MKKLYPVLLFFCCLPALNYLRAQCSVSISTNTNTTQLNCTNRQIILTANAEGAEPVLYKWNNSTGSKTRSITVDSTGNYEVIIISNASCTTKAKITITVDTLKPVVSVRSFPEKICAGEAATLIAFGAQSYTWQPPVNPSSEVITVSPDATTQYTVTGTASNGCSSKASFELVVNPLPTATIAGSTSVCQNAAQPVITFKGQNGTPPYLFSYQMNNGPTQTIQSGDDDESVQLSAPTGATGLFDYRLVSVRDSNGCLQEQPGSAMVNVFSVPVLTSSKDESVCDLTPFNYTATGSAGSLVLGWTRPVVAGIGNAAVTGAGNIINESLDNISDLPVIVTYIFSLSAGSGCVTTDTLKVTVHPTPVIAALNNQSFCNGQFVSGGISFTSSSPGAVFTWANSNINIGLAQGGTGNIPPFIASNTGSAAISATITVSVKTGIGNCSGADSAFDIRVLPAPALTSSKVRTVCDDAPFNYTATSSASATLFSWQRPEVPGISNVANSENSATINETLNNTTDQPVTVTYFFSLSTGSGCVAADSIKVMVNPTPVINHIPDTTFCNGIFVTEGIPFSSSSPAAAFRWTNNNTRIGLPAGGNGSIPPFNATNTGNANLNAIITVFVKAGRDSCEGVSQTFRITIRPAPLLTSLKARSVCNDSLFTYIATSSVAGTIFKWKRPAVDGISNGADSANSGNISERLNNTTTEPKTVEYIFTLSTPGVSCVTTEVVQVTVNPSPRIDSLRDTSFCNGDFVKNGISFSGKPSEAVFRWTNDNMNIGLPASGNGNIPPFNATNPNAFPIEATITVYVKASADSCEGASGRFRITIYPGPVLTSAILESVCTDTSFNYLARSSASGTSFNWRRILPPAVTGNPLPDIVFSPAINDTLRNTDTAVALVRYEFNLSLSENDGCKSKDTLDVLVFPTPLTRPMNDTTFCNGNAVTNGLRFAANTSLAAFTWNNNNTGIGLPAGGSGSITPFIATNSTNDSISSSVTVSVSVNNGRCRGPESTFRLIVFPSPRMTSSRNASFCNDSLFAFTASGSAAGTAFQWNRPMVNDITPETGAGNTAEIRETLHNPTANSIIVHYLFRLKTGSGSVIADSTGCTAEDTLFVTVNPTPVIDSISDTAFCNKTSVTNGILFGSPTPNRTFYWTNDNTSIGLPASGTGNIPSFIATNNDTIPQTATITVTIKASSDSCAGLPDTFKITVYPSAKRPGFYSLVDIVDSSELTLCKGSDNISFNIEAPAPGTSYEWAFRPFTNTNALIRDKNDPNTVISFPDAGIFHIQAIATNFSYGGCKDTVTQQVTVNSTPGIEERRIFLKQPGNLLVYPDNTLSRYIWGYDSVLSVSPDSSFGPPEGNSLLNQNLQFFILENKFITASGGIDTTNYLYWVYLLNEASGCTSRVYFNGPYAAKQARLAYVSNPAELLVLPNPNRGSFEISLKGNIYGNIQANIYNAGGQKVFSKKFVKMAPEIYERFNTGQLSDGIYFLELHSSDLKKVVTRFIIQH